MGVLALQQVFLLLFSKHWNTFWRKLKMFFDIVILISVASSLIAIAYAVAKNIWIRKLPVEDDNLKRIAGFISEGAQAFLKR